MLPANFLANLARLWTDFPLRVKASVLIGLPLIILGATGLIVLSSNSLRENNAQLWVDHTVVVRAKLGLILNKLLVTESAARSYVISPRSDTRPRLDEAQADIAAQIEELGSMVQDNPDQLDEVKYLRALATEKFAALETLLLTAKSETSEVKEGLALNEQAMEPLHATLARIDREEGRLQTIRSAALQRSRRIIISTATQTLLLGFLAGIGAALLFASIIARRMEDLQTRARAMRAGLPLDDDQPSQDEIGQVKKELTATSERLAERTRELHRREGELSAIIDNTTALVYVRDIDSRFLLLNRSMEKILGLTAGQVVGQTPEKFFSAEAAEQIRTSDLQVLQSGQPAEFEEQIEQEGTPRTYLSMKVPLLDENGTPYAVCGISTDITERQRAAEELQGANERLEEAVAKRTIELRETNQHLRAESAQHQKTAETLQRTQTQLLQAQKMEVAGTVACGIAHDFNNVLTAIMGYASLLLGSLGDPDHRQAHAAKIMRTAERAAALSRQLLAFGRVQPNESRLIDLAEIVRESEGMLALMLGDTIELQLAVPPGLAVVRVDPGQIEQVLLNLAVNARDAMPRGGAITIAATRREIADRKLPKAVAGAAGWVEISVTDEGTGIAPEMQARLFEPFFTSKRKGAGGGLGLATSRMIAEQHHGWMECESEPGHGSTFRLILPRVDEAPASVPVKSTQPTRGGNETVLIVEDEPAVGEIVALLLQNLGYQVLKAENGESAERVIADHAGQIDLVLTDLNMPRMNGRELIDRLTQANPHLRVILTSGAEIEEGEGAAPSAKVDFLPKPFSRHILAEKVRAALDR